jgi:hypothetical protein
MLAQSSHQGPTFALPAKLVFNASPQDGGRGVAEVVLDQVPDRLFVELLSKLSLWHAESHLVGQ